MSKKPTVANPATWREVLRLLQTAPETLDFDSFHSPEQMEHFRREMEPRIVARVKRIAPAQPEALYGCVICKSVYLRGRQHVGPPSYQAGMGCLHCRLLASRAWRDFFDKDGPGEKNIVGVLTLPHIVEEERAKFLQLITKFATSYTEEVPPSFSPATLPALTWLPKLGDDETS